jgi:hypothetical protein
MDWRVRSVSTLQQVFEFYTYVTLISLGFSEVADLSLVRYIHMFMN